MLMSGLALERAPRGLALTHKHHLAVGVSLLGERSVSRKQMVELRVGNSSHGLLWCSFTVTRRHMHTLPGNGMSVKESVVLGVKSCIIHFPFKANELVFLRVLEFHSE